MEKGNARRFYLSASGASTFTWLEGEQSNSFNRSAETIDISDKDGDWMEVLAGRRGATADVTVHLDDSSGEPQHSMLAAFHEGDYVYCFVGVLGSGSTPSSGDFFKAVITAINDTAEKDGVASRQMTLQSSGEPTHYPSV